MTTPIAPTPTKTTCLPAPNPTHPTTPPWWIEPGTTPPWKSEPRPMPPIKTMAPWKSEPRPMPTKPTTSPVGDWCGTKPPSLQIPPPEAPQQATQGATFPRNCWDPRFHGAPVSRHDTRDGELLITLPSPDSPIQ